MVEGLSLAGMIETPVVIHIGQRPGPATGLPTRTSQENLLFALYAGHGEFPRFVCAPKDQETAFHTTMRAFELAEKYQIPGIILTDQFLVDSSAVIPTLDPTRVPLESHTLSPEELAQISSYERFALTPSGVSPRALPGVSPHLVLVDSDEHDTYGRITEDLALRKALVEKRLRKEEGLRKEAELPLIYKGGRNCTAVLGWGSTFGALKEAVDALNVLFKTFGPNSGRKPEIFWRALTKSSPSRAIPGGSWGSSWPRKPGSSPPSTSPATMAVPSPRRGSSPPLPMKPEDFLAEVEIAWCPGCGNFQIREALAKLGLLPHQVVLVTGIGQAAKIVHYLRVNGFDGLHGRTVAAAAGLKMARPNLVVIAESGDGDLYGEGGNHLIHNVRRNLDIAVIAHDNRVYGLTKGQASPTAPLGYTTRAQPFGVLSTPLNPLALALAVGAGFVAQAFAGEVERTAELIASAIEYRGFALLNVLHPCPSWNRVQTFAWYKARVYPVEEVGHDPSDWEGAMRLAAANDDRIPTGILYKAKKPTFEERHPVLQRLIPGLAEFPTSADLQALLAEFL